MSAHHAKSVCMALRRTGSVHCLCDFVVTAQRPILLPCGHKTATVNPLGEPEESTRAEQGESLCRCQSVPYFYICSIRNRTNCM